MSLTPETEMEILLQIMDLLKKMDPESVKQVAMRCHILLHENSRDVSSVTAQKSKG